jgi:hypothetical protein
MQAQLGYEIVISLFQGLSNFGASNGGAILSPYTHILLILE